jgi:hypothetical protein
MKGLTRATAVTVAMVMTTVSGTVYAAVAKRSAAGTLTAGTAVEALTLSNARRPRADRNQHD